MAWDGGFLDVAPNIVAGVAHGIVRVVDTLAKVVTGVARLTADLVAGVSDLVGDALVTVGLAPGFLGLDLGLAVVLLDVVLGMNSLSCGRLPSDRGPTLWVRMSQPDHGAGAEGLIGLAGLDWVKAGV